jgi:hypothetical protein
MGILIKLRKWSIDGCGWLKNAVEYNGTIPEKFNLETSSHKVFAEYGNVGTELIIFQRRFWLGKCIIPIRFANFEW